MNKLKRTQRTAPRGFPAPSSILPIAVILLSNFPQVVATSNKGVWNQHGIIQCFVEVDSIGLVDRPERYSWTISLDRIVVDGHNSETTQGIGEYPISLDWNRVRNKLWRTSGSLDLAVPLSEQMIEHKDGNTISAPVVSTTVVVGFWMAQKSSRYQGEPANAQTLLVRRLVNLRPQQPVATVTLTLVSTAQGEGSEPIWSIASVLSCVGISISSLLAGIVACSAWLNHGKKLEEEEHNSQHHPGGDQQDPLQHDQQDLRAVSTPSPCLHDHITNRHIFQTSEESAVFESDLSVMSRRLSREPSSDDDDEPNFPRENIQPPRLYRCAHLRHFAPTPQPPMRPRVRFEDEVGLASFSSDRELPASPSASQSSRKVSALKISTKGRVQESSGPALQGRMMHETTRPVQLRATESRTREKGFSQSPSIAANPSHEDRTSIPDANLNQPSALSRLLQQEKENCSMTHKNSKVSRHSGRVEQTNSFRDSERHGPSKQLQRVFHGLDPPSCDERLKTLQEDNLRPAVTHTAILAEERCRPTDAALLASEAQLAERSRTLQENQTRHGVSSPTLPTQEFPVNSLQSHRSGGPPLKGAPNENDPMNRLCIRAQLFAKAEDQRSRTAGSEPRASSDAQLAHESPTLQENHLGRDVGNAAHRTKESPLSSLERNKFQGHFSKHADADRLDVRVQLSPSAEGQQSRPTRPDPQALEPQLVDGSFTLQENQPRHGVGKPILRMKVSPLHSLEHNRSQNHLVKGADASLSEQEPANNPSRLNARVQLLPTEEGQRSRPTDADPQALFEHTADGSRTSQESHPDHDVGDATLPAKEALLKRNTSQDRPFKCADANLDENEQANTNDRLDVQAQLIVRAAGLRPRMRDESTEGTNTLVVGEGLTGKGIAESPVMEECDLSKTTRVDHGGYRRTLQDELQLRVKGKEDENPMTVLGGSSTSDLRMFDCEPGDQTLGEATEESNLPTNEDLQNAGEKRGNVQKIEQLRTESSLDGGNCKHAVKKDDKSCQNSEEAVKSSDPGNLKNDTKTLVILKDDGVSLEDGNERQEESRALIENQSIYEERKPPGQSVCDHMNDSIEGVEESADKSGYGSTLGREIDETTNGAPDTVYERKNHGQVLCEKGLRGNGDEHKAEHRELMQNQDISDERKPPGREVHDDTIGDGQESPDKSSDEIRLEREIGGTSNGSPDGGAERKKHEDVNSGEELGENSKQILLLGEKFYDGQRVNEGVSRVGDDEKSSGGLCRGNTELTQEPATSKNELDTTGKVASRMVTSAPEKPLKSYNKTTIPSTQTSDCEGTTPTRLFDVSNAKGSDSKKHWAGFNDSQGSECPSQNSYVSTLPPHSDCSPTPEAIAKRQRPVPSKGENKSLEITGASGYDTKLVGEESKRKLRSSKLKHNQLEKDTVKLEFTPTDSGQPKRKLRSSKLKHNQLAKSDAVKLEFTPTDSGQPKRKLRSSKLKHNQLAKSDAVTLDFTPTDSGEPKRKLRSSKLKHNQSAKKTFGSSAGVSFGQILTPPSDDSSVEFVKTVRLTDPIPEPAVSSSLKSAAEKLGKKQIWLYNVDDGVSSAVNPITAKKRKKPSKKSQQKISTPERAAKKSRKLFAPKAPNL